MEGVMFGNNIVKNGRIHQEVQWTAPVLKHNVFEDYIIRFADGLQALLNKVDNRIDSPESNTTLQLDFSTSNITYYVHVALKPTKERGDFSDPVSITYTSEYLWAQYIFEICIILRTSVEPYITSNEPHSSCSTSRPDTCQQNLSQHHTPVVPT